MQFIKSIVHMNYTHLKILDAIVGVQAWLFKLQMFLVA
jgi:hypothetical protein